MELIRTEDHGGIWVLSFARPPVNAIDLSLIDAFYNSIRSAADSDSCRAVVITGDPPAFSAGVDVKLVPRYDDAMRAEMIRGINRTIHQLYRLPKPTVAAINGHALGGGLVVALGCDFRFAAEGAYLMGLTEITAGIPFPAVPMAVVQAELDRNPARYLTLSGVTFGPTDPLAATFLDGTCGPQQLMDVAIARAKAAAELPVYAKVKHQLKAAAFDWTDRIVKDDNDPMLRDWL
jgi:enoyl-CoA hydratase